MQIEEIPVALPENWHVKNLSVLRRKDGTCKVFVFCDWSDGEYEYDKRIDAELPSEVTLYSVPFWNDVVKLLQRETGEPVELETGVLIDIVKEEHV